METKNLYQIQNEYLTIIQELESNGGELTPELEQGLTINEKELQGKSIAYLEVIKDREALVSRIDEEIKRLQAMKKAQTNLITRLKDNLLTAVKVFGSFESGLVKFGTRKSSKIEIEIDTNDLPKEYKVIKVTETPDKTALKNAIKAGEKIEGVELVEQLNLKIG
jgi:hypothetical protein